MLRGGRLIKFEIASYLQGRDIARRSRMAADSFCDSSNIHVRPWPFLVQSGVRTWCLHLLHRCSHLQYAV